MGLTEPVTGLIAKICTGLYSFQNTFINISIYLPLIYKVTNLIAVLIFSHEYIEGQSN